MTPPARDAARVREAEAADGPALTALFEAASSPCFCRFWHFEGDKNAWLSRCYVETGENRSEALADLEAGHVRARGLVAEGGAGEPALVGWLKVAPAEVVPKAYAQNLYRKLPCFEGDRTGVHLVACSLVHPAHRRRGVLRDLVRGAIALAPSWGATSLEALPRRPREPVHDEELWVGHAQVFLDEGFEEVHAFEPYPVLRRVLRSRSQGPE